MWHHPPLWGGLPISITKTKKCSQGHFLNSGSLFSMTSFYQVDKNLTRTLYTLQAVPLLKCYVCPHSPWGISLLGESQAQWEPGGKYALPRERTGIVWGWGGIYNIVTAPVSQLPWSQSSIVPICLPRRIFWVFGATYFPIAQSFDPNFLQTNRLEEEVVPMTEGQMPKRKRWSGDTKTSSGFAAMWYWCGTLLKHKVSQ